MDHNQYLTKYLESRTRSGLLKSRESSTVEYKESYNKTNIAKYAKTMAAFANRRGGYILFGIKDAPRTIIGLKNDKFDNLSQEQFTDALNSLFAPAIDWDCGTITVEIEESDANGIVVTRTAKIGWIYAGEAEMKPVIAQKNIESEHIVSGDIFYRYRARTEKIKFAEIVQIMEARSKKERDNLLKVLEVIRNSDTANLGIVNYSNGRLTTPYGMDVAFDRKLVTQVLRKAKFIKEGSFNETTGIPVIRVTGNIDLAEEVPVPDSNPDDTHPYIQKQLAEILQISSHDLYALIWYYKMKEANKYHLEITTSSSSKTHKFSQFALQFLHEKLKELSSKPEEFDTIRTAYKNRNIKG